MRISIECQATHLCPHVDERDLGGLYACWSGDVELHAVAGFVRTFAEEHVTHEAMTAAVRRFIEASGGTGVVVETTWRTAGLDVRVVDTEMMAEDEDIG